MSIFVWLLILLPLLLCSINAILNRVSGAHPHKTPFTSGLYVNMLFMPFYIYLHFNFYGTAWAPLVYGIVFFLLYLNCVVFINWFIFALTDASMHIQLMMQLSRAGSIPIEQLVERYNKNTILQNRVPRLIELGQLQLVNGRLVVTGRSVLLGAAICQLLRRILGIPVRPEDADHSK